MLNSAKELITEYCTLTGRPVASLTVDEYLKFKAVNIIPTIPINKEENSDTSFIQPIQINKIEKDSKETVKTKEKVIIEDAKKPKENINQNMALSMLKSIKG